MEEETEDTTDAPDGGLLRAFAGFLWAWLKPILVVVPVAWIAGETIPWWALALLWYVATNRASIAIQCARNELNEARFKSTERVFGAMGGFAQKAAKAIQANRGAQEIEQEAPETAIIH